MKKLTLVNTLLIIWVFVSIESISGRVYSLQQRGIRSTTVVEEVATPASPPAAGEATASDGAPAPAAAARVTLSVDRLEEIGAQVFKAVGSNTCNDCHGAAGYGGRLPEAPDLRRPSTWKAYKVAKGDLEAMEGPITELIRHGAGVWNTRHAEPVYDVTMLGVVQGATKSELRKIRKSLKRNGGVSLTMDQALDLGARATYAYLKTLWLDEDEGSPPASPTEPGSKPETAPEAPPGEGTTAG